MVEKVGICIVGCGGYGAVHAASFSALDGIRLFFSSRDPAKAAAYARRFSGEALPSFEDALAEGRVDGMVLCTPHHRHAEGAEAVLRAGKSLLLEKPLARSTAEGERIAGAAAASQGKLLIGENYAFLPALGPLRAALEGGRIGSPRAARAVHRKKYSPSGWRLDRRLMGGGLLADMGPHYLRLLETLLGPVRRVRLDAARRPIAEMEGESEFELSLEMRDAATAALEVSWARDWDRSIPTLRIEGTEGSLAYILDAPGILWSGNGRSETLPVETADPLGRRALVRHFLAVVRGEAEPAVGAAEGLRDLRVVEAAYRSLEKGGWEEP